MPDLIIENMSENDFRKKSLWFKEGRMGLGKLTKKIPARTKTVEFNWAYKYHIQCTEKYMEIRNNLGLKRAGTILGCDWCKKPFEKDEWFCLAQPKGKVSPRRNWALCHDCADKINAPIRKGKEDIAKQEENNPANNP